MKRAIPPPNWLHTFEAAARCLSFTDAAQELGITPSAVSQQIRLLEQTLGLPLFHRLPKGLELTGDGLAYLPAIQEGFQRMAESTQALFGGGRGLLLTLRSNAAFALLWLSPRLPRFRQAHPDVALRVNVSIWLTETDWDGVSLEIRYGGGDWPGFKAERLTRERLFPVCAPALADGPPGLHRPADLATHPLIHLLGDAEGWPRWLALAGVEDLKANPGLQFDSSAVALEAAAAGAGVVLGKQTFADPYLRTGRLVRPFEAAIDSDEGFFLVSPEGRVDPPQAAAFRAWLHAEAAREAPSSV